MILCCYCFCHVSEWQNHSNCDFRQISVILNTKSTAQLTRTISMAIKCLRLNFSRIASENETGSFSMERGIAAGLVRNILQSHIISAILFAHLHGSTLRRRWNMCARIALGCAMKRHSIWKDVYLCSFFTLVMLGPG